MSVKLHLFQMVPSPGKQERALKTNWKNRQNSYWNKSNRGLSVKVINFTLTRKQVGKVNSTIASTTSITNTALYHSSSTCNRAHPLQHLLAYFTKLQLYWGPVAKAYSLFSTPALGEKIKKGTESDFQQSKSLGTPMEGRFFPKCSKKQQQQN